MGILQKLIEQSRLPHGFIGKVMLKIMNNAHKELTLWGISKLSKGKNVLDASCGGGSAIGLLSKSGKFERIYGIDLSPEAVALASDHNKDLIEKGDVYIQQASVLELPFENDYFDAITTFQSHYHWPDILQAVQGIRHKLKAGGQFVLVAEKYKIEYHMKEYNNAGLTGNLLLDAGFRNVELFESGKHICVSGIK
ncbi:class I SAM-dependent methyltransferase [Paenibacillus sp. CAU 1782]